MQYVLLIYQPTTSTPTTPEAWATYSQDETKVIGAEYGAISRTPASPPACRWGFPRTPPPCGCGTPRR
jgi:hypothetical protein